MNNHLLVIYDSDAEIGAIVDGKNRRAAGPAMVGPNARHLLQAFIDSAPFDLSLLGSIELCEAFTSFLEQVGVGSTDTAGEAPETPAQPAGDSTVADAAALAQREAANAGDVPAAAPADTDYTETPTQTDQVVNCVNCNGTGMVTFGNDQPAQTCGMCKGSGKITIPAPVA